MNKIVQVTVGTVAVDYAIDRKITPVNIVANIAASVVADKAQKIAKMNDTVSDLASNAAATYFINQIMGNKSMTMARLAAYTVISSDLVGKQISRANTKVMKKIEPVPAPANLTGGTEPDPVTQRNPVTAAKPVNKNFIAQFLQEVDSAVFF